MAAERNSSFYDSKYLAEYYDLWAESNKEALDTQGDASVYFEALQAHLAAGTQHNACVVLDVGTGTGRILVNLANDALETSLDFSRVDLIGVDNEPAMLVRAKEIQHETRSMARARSITWILGEAATLTTLPELSPRLGSVDMLLFGVGSVSHLIGADEPQRFFGEVFKLLRPEHGVMYLPIQDDLISERSITERPALTQTWAELDVAQEFHSKLYSNLVYKQFPIESSEVNDSIKTDKYRFEVVRRSADGRTEESVENNAIQLSLRLWKESEVIAWAEGAGLTCIKTSHTSHETYYMFKRQNG